MFLSLQVSLLLFISSPLSVLAATQELTRLGRVRLYPLKGKFLMRLQKPPPPPYQLCIYFLQALFPPLVFVFLLWLPRLSFLSSDWNHWRSSLVILAQTNPPGVLLFLPSCTLPSTHSSSIPASPPVMCFRPPSSWPQTLLLLSSNPSPSCMSEARSQTWAQTADSVYKKPPSWFYMPWN